MSKAAEGNYTAEYNGKQCPLGTSFQNRYFWYSTKAASAIYCIVVACFCQFNGPYRAVLDRWAPKQKMPEFVCLFRLLWAVHKEDECISGADIQTTCQQTASHRPQQHVCSLYYFGNLLRVHKFPVLLRLWQKLLDKTNGTRRRYSGVSIYSCCLQHSQGLRMSPVSDSSTNGVKVTSGALNDRVTVFIAHLIIEIDWNIYIIQIWKLESLYEMELNGYRKGSLF